MVSISPHISFTNCTGHGESNFSMAKSNDQMMTTYEGPMDSVTSVYDRHPEKDMSPSHEHKN